MDAGYVCHPLTLWSILVCVLSVNYDLYRLNSVPVDLIGGPGFRVCVCVLEMLSLFFFECILYPFVYYCNCCIVLIFLVHATALWWRVSVIFFKILLAHWA